ncbi:hypothetical protein BDR05DRAFT_953596 [Suillus weaverae]|nr:hypothetical protein BDR05DRAFT_953596 [Suillus weaverae]
MPAVIIAVVVTFTRYTSIPSFFNITGVWKAVGIEAASRMGMGVNGTVPIIEMVPPEGVMRDHENDADGRAMAQKPREGEAEAHITAQKALENDADGLVMAQKVHEDEVEALATAQKAHEDIWGARACVKEPHV